MWKIRLVGFTWLLASAWYLVTTVGHLFRLPQWDSSIREHLSRYPSEVPTIIVAFLVAMVSVATVSGNPFATRVLRWCSWLALVGAASLFVSIVVIAVLESETSEPVGYVCILLAVAASAISVFVLSKRRAVA